MPRSLQEILDNADAYAKRCEEFVPDPADVRDAAPLRKVAEAVSARAGAEAALAHAVADARDAGFSWASIAAFLGTSAEAARQRYSAAAKAR